VSTVIDSSFAIHNQLQSWFDIVLFAIHLGWFWEPPKCLSNRYGGLVHLVRKFTFKPPCHDLHAYR